MTRIRGSQLVVQFNRREWVVFPLGQVLNNLGERGPHAHVVTFFNGRDLKGSEARIAISREGQVEDMDAEVKLADMSQEVLSVGFVKDGP